MTQAKNLELFGDDMCNPLDTGSIFLISGSLFVSNIMEQWVDIHDFSGYGHKELLSRLVYA